jgi:hypothetical protein
MMCPGPGLVAQAGNDPLAAEFKSKFFGYPNQQEHEQPQQGFNNAVYGNGGNQFGREAPGTQRDSINTGTNGGEGRWGGSSGNGGDGGGGK